MDYIGLPGAVKEEEWFISRNFADDSLWVKIIEEDCQINIKDDGTYDVILTNEPINIELNRLHIGSHLKYFLNGTEGDLWKVNETVPLTYGIFYVKNITTEETWNINSQPTYDSTNNVWIINCTGTYSTGDVIRVKYITKDTDSKFYIFIPSTEDYDYFIVEIHAIFSEDTDIENTAGLPYSAPGPFIYEILSGEDVVYRKKYTSLRYAVSEADEVTYIPKSCGLNAGLIKLKWVYKELQRIEKGFRVNLYPQNNKKYYSTSSTYDSTNDTENIVNIDIFQIMFKILKVPTST